MEQNHKHHMKLVFGDAKGFVWECKRPNCFYLTQVDRWAWEIMSKEGRVATPFDYILYEVANRMQQGLVHVNDLRRALEH